MLLITDLDNTLYDWVTFFAKSFEAMLDALVRQLGEPRSKLVKEFKAVHQHYGNSEHPFAVFDLPSVRSHFPNASRRELLDLLSEPLHAFNSARKQYLKLYDDVAKTLRTLTDHGVVIVGHSEAIAVNAFYRLDKLAIAPHFRRLYVLESRFEGHPDPERQKSFQIPNDFVREVPKSERKPNPALLKDICQREGVHASDCWYVGDSIVRDISMAREAGITSVWARYGTSYDRKLWEILVSITHWTDEDVSREERLQSLYHDVEPDFTVDAYSELLALIPGCASLVSRDGN